MAKIRITLVDADGAAHTVHVAPGRSLMRAATDAGIEGIAADCGGAMNCATCHVFVDPPWLARLEPPDADERAMLEMTATPARADSRLSCQILLQLALDGLVVRLPASQY